MLRTNQAYINSTLGTSQIKIQENLFAVRKLLLNKVKLTKHELNLKFLWTTQGQIRLRRDSLSKEINVNSVSDWTKLGYCGNY